MNSILILVLSAAAFAPVNAPVDRVTVFSDRAEVMRKAVVSCKSGENLSIAFPLLPARIDAKTFRADTGPGAVATGVMAGMREYEKPLNPERAAIMKELQEIEDKRSLLDSRDRTIRERQNTAEAYATYLQGIMREALRGEKEDIDLWRNGMDLVRAERINTASALLELAEERRELDLQDDLLRRKLAATGSSMPDRRDMQGYEVNVEIGCEKAGRTEVFLSYVIPGATWSPEYDFRFVSEGGDGIGKGRASVDFSAVVRQATGEDWNNAELVFSTARPRLGAAAPIPAPIYVDGREVGKQRMLVQDVEDRRSLPESPSEAPTPSEPAQASLDDGGRAFTLSVPGRVNLRGDGRPYRFPVHAIQAEASGRRVSIPKLSPYVYRAVKLDNTAPFPLMEGTMHVYRDGLYVGKINLEYTAPGAPMEISMGPDESVRVTRHDISDVDRSPGFLSRTRTMERAYRMEIENGTAGPVSVELRDNIPVSRVDDIRVVLQEDKTSPGYSLDEGRGIISWQIDVEKNEKASVNLGFRVQLPEDWELAVAN